ncbi:MAG: LPS export ABC transporter permease LptG [Pantoea sp. Brub]|nr:LPS export ABC transporter permease LptG [Pantoea sp. Brub]
MLNIFYRYINYNILNAVLFVLFILISLSSIINFADQCRHIRQEEYDIIDACYYTIFSIPKNIELFFPMIVLLGAVLGLSLLDKHNELLAMQIAGFSNLQITISVVKTAVPLIFISIIIGELIIPTSEKIAHNHRTDKLYHNNIKSIQNKGLWLKDANNFINIKHIKNDNNISEISIYCIQDQYRLKSISYIDNAIWNPNKKIWISSNTYKSIFNNFDQIINTKTKNEVFKTNLTPNQIKVSKYNPKELSILMLYDYIKYLNQSGQISTIYQLNMYRKILIPFSIIVMLIMATLFMLGPLKNANINIRAITSISFSCIYYILEKILDSISLISSFSPIISAILPILIFFLICIYILINFNQEYC